VDTASGACEVAQAKGPDKHFEVDVGSLGAGATATVWRLDASHGNVLAAYRRMGCPAFPSREQVAELRIAAKPAPAQRLALDNGHFSVDIPPQGLVVIALH
jgi:xylan 1,4-beta-xylosidase